MIDWIELIKPYTKHIVINRNKEEILLVHPHFQKVKQAIETYLKQL